MRQLSAKTVLFTLAVVSLFLFAACNRAKPTAIEARAIFELSRVYIDEQQVNISETNYAGSALTFVGPESGGNVLLRIGEDTVQASINPSRDHPSFEAGYWHLHLYSGVTAEGSPRINLRELLPNLGIDDSEDAIDNTQSLYQRGNLHYIVATGEYRLRFIIDGFIHDLIFVEV